MEAQPPRRDSDRVSRLGFLAGPDACGRRPAEGVFAPAVATRAGFRWSAVAHRFGSATPDVTQGRLGSPGSRADASRPRRGVRAVSYTHLTLPTNREV